jgi:hypothetical protein
LSPADILQNPPPPHVQDSPLSQFVNPSELHNHPPASSTPPQLSLNHSPDSPTSSKPSNKRPHSDLQDASTSEQSKKPRTLIPLRESLASFFVPESESHQETESKAKKRFSDICLRLARRQTALTEKWRSFDPEERRELVQDLIDSRNAYSEEITRSLLPTAEKNRRSKAHIKDLKNLWTFVEENVST